MNLVERPTIIYDNAVPNRRRIVDADKANPKACIHRRPMTPGGRGMANVELCPSCTGEIAMLEAKDTK